MDDMHVPEENLRLYRRISDIARRLDTVGNHLSGVGLYDHANTAWGLSADVRKQAYALRVPGKDEE
jgi:hypothetical protein